MRFFRLAGASVSLRNIRMIFLTFDHTFFILEVVSLPSLANILTSISIERAFNQFRVVRVTLRTLRFDAFTLAVHEGSLHWTQTYVETSVKGHIGLAHNHAFFSLEIIDLPCLAFLLDFRALKQILIPKSTLRTLWFNTSVSTTMIFGCLRVTSTPIVFFVVRMVDRTHIDTYTLLETV